MGESTDYTTLGIVAMVAIVAIFAMISTQQVSAPAAMYQSEQTVLGAAITSPLPAYSLLDYTGDGIISAADSAVLADAIAFGVCPMGYVCDVDGNGVVDERDLQRLNAAIPSVQETVSEAPVISANAVLIPYYEPKTAAYILA